MNKQDTQENAPDVCPVRMARMLDNPLRRWLTGSRNIARTFLREGMTVLDVGCGPSPMLLDMTKIVGPTGQIICADIQPGMLLYVEKKIEKHNLTGQVRTHLSQPDTIGIKPASVDFVIAFWMLHETPDPDRYLAQISECLKPQGRLLLVEPSMHVKKDDFQHCLALATNHNLKLTQQPRIRMSRAALFEKQTS